jgi:hypothetical protein
MLECISEPMPGLRPVPIQREESGIYTCQYHIRSSRHILPMSCAFTLFSSHLRSNRRSIFHNHYHSIHWEILSYPARFVVLLRSMSMEPRPWVVDLSETLEDLRVRENQVGYRSSDEDDEEWSQARPTSRRTLREERRTMSSTRYEGRGRSSEYTLTGSAYRQELSRSPPPRRLEYRFAHRYEPTDQSPSPPRHRHRQQTHGPSSPRRDSSGLNDRDISPEHGATPEHSLQREKGRSVTKPGLPRQFSGPGLEPITPAPSSRYMDASYTQSSRSRRTNRPVTTYHQEFRPELPSTPISRSRGPRTGRRESKAAQPVGRSFTNNSTELSGLRRTTSQPSRRTSTELVMEDDPWINFDSGEVNQPYFLSKDQAESSELQSYFRGRRRRAGIKGLKVEFSKSKKEYTVIDPRLPRKKPKRTELSTPRLGREDQFTDLAFEFWEEDVERARGEAGHARSRAEFLYNYAQRNWAERLLLKIL